MFFLAQAATAGVGAELKALRQQRDALEDQIQRLEASLAHATRGAHIHTRTGAALQQLAHRS